MILLADVRVFLEIATRGSFTAAAQSLGAPKSSLARHLARLEEQLGRQLVARTTRHVELTEHGRTFLPHARRLLDDESEALNVLRAGADGASGLLTVSAPATFGRRFLAPHLPDFRRAHRNVRVCLRLTATKVDIGVGQTDVAFRLGALVEANVAARRMGEIEYALVAAPGYLAGRKPLWEPFDLAAVDFLELRPPAMDHRVTLHSAGEERSLRYVPSLEMDDPEGLKAAALADGGVAALPLFLVEDELKSGTLVRVLDRWAPAPAPIHLIYASKTTLPLRVRAFLDFTQSLWGQAFPWQGGPGRGAAA